MHYVFGDCTLDTQRYELRRGGVRLPLRRKVFQVLMYLIEQRDRVVSRDEVLAQVWPDQYVGEETLTSCVKAVRHAVGDSGRAQRVIQSVRGHGLRFVADVSVTDAPVAPRLALAPAAALASARPVPGLLVGREAELAALHRWYTIARQGTRQVGFITGEAGVGKTALVEAFVAQIGAEGAVWIGHGQCIEQYGTGEAYLPVLEALGRLCRGPQGAPVLAWLQRQAPSWLAQMPALLSAAERDAVLHLAGAASQPRMLRELAEALEILTTEQPLLLVLEDLHWSDAATLEWLAYVARRQDPARLLVLATCRPAEARAASHPVSALVQDLLIRNQGNEIRIGALSAPEVALYVARRFGEGPLVASLAPVLYQRTQGHALFLVTTVADLVQRGVVWHGPDGWELAAPLEPATVGVPETLRHLIEQQFERLSPAAQAVVAAASVAGVEFAAAAVAAGVGVSAEEVDAQCATLARHGQFVRANGPATWPDGTVTGRYGFGHALYQEVVYDRLPVGARTRMHQQIGARLELGYGEQARTIAAELAMHFVHGRDTHRAIRYLQQAAENARQRHAHREVMEHCTTGLALLTALLETPERTRHELALQALLGPTLVATQGYAAPDVERTYARARELCRTLGDPPELFAVLCGQVLWHVLRGQYQTAQALAEQVLRIAQQRNDPVSLVEAHAALGTLLVTRGALEAGCAHLEAGWALYRPEQHCAHIDGYGQDPAVICLHFLSQALWLRGYPDQALARLDAVLHLARELAHPVSLLFSLNSAALLHQHCRNGQAVQQWAEAIIALATEQELPYWRTLGTMYHGWALAAQGQMEAGIAQVQQGLAAYRATGARFILSRCLGLLAELHGRAGQLDAGRTVLAEACAVVRQDGLSSFAAELYRIQGDFLLQTGTRHQEGEAEASLLQALAIARQQQAKAYELRAAVSLGRLWQRQGKPDAAWELLRPIYGWFTEGWWDTADLRDARALLEDLAWEAPDVQREPRLSPYARNGARAYSA
jgi:DNA-binding winged helix-turn-helix (wHTH) protein/predicted ATPase